MYHTLQHDNSSCTESKMPSRLIQGLDSFDTCSQFSDSATLHTLTRVGGLQRAVYFSQSESNFNNFDTISYGNSSTCCCDPDIKVNIIFILMYELHSHICAMLKLIRINFFTLFFSPFVCLFVRSFRWIYKRATQFINAIQRATLKKRANCIHQLITLQIYLNVSNANERNNGKLILIKWWVRMKSM